MNEHEHNPYVARTDLNEPVKNHAWRDAGKAPPHRPSWTLRVFVAVVAAGVLFVWYGSTLPPSYDAKALVESRLRDPESVQYRATFNSRQDSRVLCGEVNSRNGFGGMVGYRRFVSDGGDASVYFEEDRGSRVDTGFLGKWSAYCDR